MCNACSLSGKRALYSSMMAAVPSVERSSTATTCMYGYCCAMSVSSVAGRFASSSRAGTTTVKVGGCCGAMSRSKEVRSTTSGMWRSKSEVFHPQAAAIAQAVYSSTLPQTAEIRTAEIMPPPCSLQRHAAAEQSASRGRR